MKWLTRNLPNLLSAARPVLIVPFVIALAHSSYGWLAFITAIIVLSDYFDGYLARRLGAITDTGKILDPLADKICTAAAALAMVKFRDFPLWLLAAMVARDVIILLAGLVMVRTRSIVPVSDLVGRFTMGVMTACFLIYLLRIGPLELPSAYLTLLSLVLSLVSYGRNFARTFSRRPV